MIMKKYVSIGLCILMLGFPGYKLFAGSEKYELKTTEATLTIDQKGNLRIVKDKGQIIQINTSINNLWKVTLKNNLNGKESVFVPDKSVRLTKIDNILQLVKDNFSTGNTFIPVKVELTISVKDDAFCFSGSLKSDSKEWQIKEVLYPDISGIKINDKNVKIYWPNSLGECFDNPQLFGSKTFEYPCTNGSMAWFSVNSPDAGLYVGSHDSSRGSKKFALSFNDSDKSFRTSINFPVYTYEFSIPDVMVKPYGGKWYNASKFYRGWYDENFKLASVSKWTRENAGLMLTILKQQNGSVMWNYKDVDKLCDIGEKLNIKLIGLWGWAVGGHDRLYPYWPPDNLMGGRKELEKAIERAHKRGFKVIVYSNGTIMDASTDFYLYNGIETMQLNERKQPAIEYYLKHSNTTPVIQVRACPGSAKWRKTIMDLALNAKSLGVDAFYIDQVGVRSPIMCYSNNHDHSVPQEAYTKYRVKMMHDIRNRMKEIDPEFSIITEGTIDELLTDIDVFHGLGPGSIITPNAFPEMFRYTFPESIIIQLNASPANDRYNANYATIYGLRHEIMSRYEADAEYLKSGKIPTAENYAECYVNDPPVLSTMNKVPAQEVTSYTHDLLQFENDNADFFRNGKFIDEDGLKVSGNDILAKGFTDGKRIGVVVWNRNLSEKRDFSITVPGYNLVKSAEPKMQVANASSPLDANSIRLLIFEKN